MITKVLVDDVYKLVYDVVEFADNVNDLVDDVTNLVHDVNDERRDVLAVTNSERKLRRILSVNPSLMGVVGPWSWLLGAVGGHELACRHAVGGRSDAVDREVRLTISTGSRSLG